VQAKRFHPGEESMRSPNDPVQVSLRFKEALRRQLAAAAKQSLRSLNREIIFRLQSSLDETSNPPRASVDQEPRAA
jgi:hypothetical protein